MMTQPKFKFGAKVRAKDGNVLVIDMISYNRQRGEYSYGYEPGCMLYAESDLTEWREPMRAEFECSFKQLHGELDGSEWRPITIIGEGLHQAAGPLFPFINKRTRVTVEEVLP